MAGKKALANKKAPAKKPARGVRITEGSKWSLTDEGGTHREFKATVLHSRTVGGTRIVLLSVPARVREKRAARKKKKKP